MPTSKDFEQMDKMLNEVGCTEERPMIYPNGLNDSQIAARPEPYAGMVGYHVGSKRWNKLLHEVSSTSITWSSERGTYCNIDYLLLPGEPGCPWPPPPKFQHEWKEGDSAWILPPRLFTPDTFWQKAYVTTIVLSKSGKEIGQAFCCGDLFLPLHVPALYTPE